MTFSKGGMPLKHSSKAGLTHGENTSVVHTMFISRPTNLDCVCTYMYDSAISDMIINANDVYMLTNKQLFSNTGPDMLSVLLLYNKEKEN